MSAQRLVVLTLTALMAFAANSLLTRGALAAGRIDAPSFLAVRLCAGAAMLWWLASRRVEASGRHASRATPWTAAAALAGYAIAFTFAYVRIGAGVGALALFGAVQATMIGVGIRTGDRPATLDVVGLVIALAGLIVLTLRGASAPSLSGVALMAIAGACWGVYSLLGRGSHAPLHDTATNFARAAPAGLMVLATQWAFVHITPVGFSFAVLSGAVTSGIGYAVWYTVVPHLGAWRAALVQLLTPVLTALAAVGMLGESMTWRLTLAGALIVGGVLLSLSAAQRRA